MAPEVVSVTPRSLGLPHATERRAPGPWTCMPRAPRREPRPAQRPHRASSPPAPDRVRAATDSSGPPGRFGATSTSGARRSRPAASCRESLRRASSATGFARPAEASSRAAPSPRTTGPRAAPRAAGRHALPVHPLDGPAAARGLEPPATRGRHQRSGPADVVRRGQRAGDVRQRQQPGVEQCVGRVPGAAVAQVEGVDGELVGLPEHDREQRQHAHGAGRGRVVELGGCGVEVGADAVAMAPQRVEDLGTGRVPVRRRDAGVGGVDVRCRARPPVPGRRDQPGERVVVVPDAQVRADLLGPPPRQPGRAVQVAGLGRGEEGAPCAEHHGANGVTTGAREATVRGRRGSSLHSTSGRRFRRAERTRRPQAFGLPLGPPGPRRPVTTAPPVRRRTRPSCRPGPAGPTPGPRASAHGRRAPRGPRHGGRPAWSSR